MKTTVSMTKLEVAIVAVVPTSAISNASDGMVEVDGILLRRILPATVHGEVFHA